MRTIVTDRQKHRHRNEQAHSYQTDKHTDTETDKPIATGKIVQICLKINLLKMAKDRIISWWILINTVDTNTKYLEITNLLVIFVSFDHHQRQHQSAWTAQMIRGVDHSYWMDSWCRLDCCNVLKKQPTISVAPLIFLSKCRIYQLLQLLTSTYKSILETWMYNLTISFHRWDTYSINH